MSMRERGGKVFAAFFGKVRFWIVLCVLRAPRHGTFRETLRADRACHTHLQTRKNFGIGSVFHLTGAERAAD